MDIPFKPIRLEDKEIITSFTFPSDYRNCDFSFANMCSWRFLYDSEFAIVDGYLLIRFMIEDKSRFAYMMPVGDGDLADVHILRNPLLANERHPLNLHPRRQGATGRRTSRKLFLYPGAGLFRLYLFTGGFSYLTG